MSKNTFTTLVKLSNYKVKTDKEGEQSYSIDATFYKPKKAGGKPLFCRKETYIHDNKENFYLFLAHSISVEMPLWYTKIEANKITTLEHTALELEGVNLKGSGFELRKLAEIFEGNIQITEETK